MRFNISNEEVKTILEMHSKAKKNTFLIKEDSESDLEKLRIAITAGCLKNGALKRSKSTGNVFYRKPSAKDPAKEVDFFADMTFKFVDGSQSGKWKCDAIATSLSNKENKAAQDAATQEKNAADKKAADSNIELLKKEGGWKSYDELIQIDTKENISNPTMYEKKTVDGIDLYRRKVSGAVGEALTDDQMKIIKKWQSQGAKLRKDLDPEESKTWTAKVVSPKSEGYFVQDLVMYFPPTTITNTDITNAFQQAVQDQTPQNSDDCKTTIEAYYMAWSKKKKIEPNMLSAMKEKVQACKNEFYGSWGAFGGGKKIDGYLDTLSGGPGGPSVGNPWRLEKESR